MKKMSIPRKICGQQVIFKSFEDKESIQIQMEVPDILQQSVLDWKYYPKWMFVIEIQIDSVHDKQKVFTYEHFEKFVNKFMWHISRNKEIGELLVSGDTKIGWIFGLYYNLDVLTCSALFSPLRSFYEFNKKVTRHTCRRKSK